MTILRFILSCTDSRMGYSRKKATSSIEGPGIQTTLTFHCMEFKLCSLLPASSVATNSRLPSDNITNSRYILHTSWNSRLDGQFSDKCQDFRTCFTRICFGIPVIFSDLFWNFSEIEKNTPKRCWRFFFSFFFFFYKSESAQYPLLAVIVVTVVISLVW